MRWLCLMTVRKMLMAHAHKISKAAPSVKAAAHKPAPTPNEAQRERAHVIKTALWLQNVWAGDEASMPAFKWPVLSALPDWALGSPEALERLALLTGTLFAAPALRLCLDAGPLLRVQALIGEPALSKILALPNTAESASVEHDAVDPADASGPSWPTDQSSERNTLYSWGAALLATSVQEPLLQMSLLRVFSLSPALMQNGLPPLLLAQRLAALAHTIMQTVVQAATELNSQVAGQAPSQQHTQAADALTPSAAAPAAGAAAPWPAQVAA
jgi:hypothetical protein